jgi:ketosteroid isomerase-like protein
VPVTSGTNRNQKVCVAPLLVPLLVGVLAVACSSPRPAAGNASTERAIRQLTLDWVAAEASNNIDSALGFLWEDATMQPPNAPSIEGHAAIRAGYESVNFASLTVGTTKVRASGDLAAIWGPLTVVIHGPAGLITLDQKFVAVWQQRDGKWKVVENSWSDNAPSHLPPAGETGSASRARSR